VAAAGAFGQSDVGSISVKKYSSYLTNEVGRVADKYVTAASDRDLERIAALSGDPEDLDTALEIALLSGCAGVVDVRPVKANEMLGTPKQADLKFGFWVFQEIQILRFLGNTAAVGRHEGELKIITDRGRVTRAEVEAYYRSGIRGLIAEIVDEEFNKVSFNLRNSDTFSIARGHNAVLTRNPQNGQYTLSYGGAYTNEEIREITKPTLNALLDEMGRREKDFDKIGIEAVKAQARLIPAVVYADWKLNNMDAMLLIKNSIIDFYLNPTQSTYEAVRGIYARYEDLTSNYQDKLAYFATTSLLNSVQGLSPELYSKLKTDVTPQTYLRFAKIPNDNKYNIFSLPYSIGGK